MNEKVYCKNCSFSSYQWHENMLIDIQCKSNPLSIDKPDTQQILYNSCYFKNIKNDCKEYKFTIFKKLKDTSFRLYLRIKNYIRTML